jgi:hypothetical protein
VSRIAENRARTAAAKFFSESAGEKLITAAALEPALFYLHCGGRRRFFTQLVLLKFLG